MVARRHGLEGALPLLPFAGIYAGYGATFGVIGGAAPLVLRAHGLSLDDIGMIQLINLPIGCAFIWAPLVDRWRLPGLPHRIGWVMGGMGATAILLGLLSLASRLPIAALFVLALGTSVTMATADVALEALVVETVAAAQRPVVTTIKLCGSSVGTMMGVALATAFPARLDLAGAIAVTAMLDAVLCLPMLTYPEGRRRTALAPRVGRPARETLGRLCRRAAVLGLFFAPAIMIVSVPGLVLVDLKLPMPLVGAYTGVISTVANIAMTLLAGVLLLRTAAWRLVAGLACGVAACGVLFAVATSLPSAALGFTAAVLIVLFEGGLGVPVFNAIYRWAEGERAATDYAFIFGVAFLVSFPARVLGPILAGRIGWPAYFVVCVPLYAVAVVLLVRTLRRTGA